MDKTVMNEAVESPKVFLVTPEEAVILSKYTRLDELTLIKQVARSVKAEFTARNREINEYFTTCVLMAVFMAGRVHGIREERIKRRQ